MTQNTSDDLIERLRQGTNTHGYAEVLMAEAADALAECRAKIEADKWVKPKLLELRAEIERLSHSIITDERNPLRAEVERVTSDRAEIFEDWHKLCDENAGLRAENERLRGALEEANWKLDNYRMSRALLGDQLVDTNKVMGDGENVRVEKAKELLVPKLLDCIVELERALAAERERIAKLVEQSEVFCEHGCTERIAELVRNETIVFPDA